MTPVGDGPAGCLTSVRPGTDMADDRNRICVARIGAAHGVRGEVRLFSFTGEPAAVARYGPFATADGRAIEIESLRPAKDCFVARLKGVVDRNAAERLRNAELYVPRERLPATETDEFYHADLVGLAVVDRDGHDLGRVLAVHNFGAGDIVEVKLDEHRDTVMLPFSAAVVPVVDLGSGRITVDLPEGTFDEEQPTDERDGSTDDDR
jgi:16S rRNA processing protein RimM